MRKFFPRKGYARCYECKTNKLESEFSISNLKKRNKTVSTVCKSCTKKSNRVYYLKNSVAIRSAIAVIARISRRLSFSSLILWDPLQGAARSRISLSAWSFHIKSTLPGSGNFTRCLLFIISILLCGDSSTAYR